MGQKWLGDCYYNGQGVEKNINEAFKWYSKSVEKGCVDAYSDLAYCYSHGEGVEQNLPKAFELYKEGAEKETLFVCLM